MINQNSIWHPLSATQRSLWFQYQIHPESRGLFNIGFCIRILDGLDPRHLRKALNALAARHSILRVRFEQIDGAPKQCVDHGATVEVAVSDIAHLSAEQLEQRLAQDMASPFDLAHAPLVRAGIYDGWHDRQCILLLVFDHLICDGWSFWRLIDELGKLLACERSGLDAGSF